MSAALIAIATQIGAPLVRKVLERRIGAGNAKLAEDVVAAVSERLGVKVDQLDKLIDLDHERVAGAVMSVEDVMPELLTVHEQALQHSLDIQMAEMQKSSWFSAWRPLGMYTILFLWIWSIVGLHVLNAVFKIALPPPDMTVLLGFSGLFLSLYMGGHTVKEVAKQWKL